MIDVILDTNVYRRNPDMSDLNFKALERLACAGIIKVHIPYIVEREFQTQQREICLKSINKTISGLSDLLRRPLTSDTLKELKKLKKTVKDKNEQILSDSDNHIVEWANRINANREPLCLDQATKSLEAYFQGTPPLKEAKIRNDIPDSFLLQSIAKICHENKSAHIVAGDKKVRDAFCDTDSVFTYEELSEFIESDLVQKVIIDLDLLKNQEETAKALKDYEEQTGEIQFLISKEIGLSILNKVIFDESIPDDNHEATIMGYGEAEDIDLSFDEVFYYGEEQFGLPFSLSIEVGAIYYIFKSDFYCIEKDKMPSISDHNDHYFEADSEFEVSVQGVVSITVNQNDLDLENLSESIDASSINISSIDRIQLLNPLYE